MTIPTITYIRTYTRPNTDIPWYGMGENVAIEDTETMAFIVNYFKNTVGLTDRYNINYNTPDDLTTNVQIEVTEEEQSRADTDIADVNSEIYSMLNKHDFYYESNGITWSDFTEIF